MLLVGSNSLIYGKERRRDNPSVQVVSHRRNSKFNTHIWNNNIIVRKVWNGGYGMFYSNVSTGHSGDEFFFREIRTNNCVKKSIENIF